MSTEGKEELQIDWDDRKNVEAETHRMNNSSASCLVGEQSRSRSGFDGARICVHKM
jgi:hypothetical protein